MPEQPTQAIIIAILGGLGLGLLLGSEYPTSSTTLLGAALILISLIAMGIAIFSEKKKETK
jgi:hypothetical protein